jgi:hypothetical protein
MIFEILRVDSQTKDYQTRRASIEFAKSLTEVTSILLDTS